jgi:2-succinyl-5-enolpyruvyl-6-hydroxy-3-cyclohexene-1-carboxylate synthase
VVNNFNTIALSSEFRKYYNPELIIHFGNAFTSKPMLDFFKYSKAYKIVVNSYGDKIDPSGTADEFVNFNPADFCQELIKLHFNESNSAKSKWYEEFLELDAEVEKIKANLIFKKRFPFEGRILKEVYSQVPEKSNLFLSNSMPVRDFDYFVSGSKDIDLYYNRGASGIDGIISSACGVGQNSDFPTTLVIGDLAFYHDLNSLYLAKRLSKPLVIILVNNSGGGIFDMLPIAGEEVDFEKYFKTPVNLSFEKTVHAFDLNYSKVESWADLKSQYNKAIKSKTSTVLEIKTNSKQSVELRRKYWEESKTTINKMINENNTR